LHLLGWTPLDSGLYLKVSSVARAVASTLGEGDWGWTSVRGDCDGGSNNGWSSYGDWSGGVDALASVDGWSLGLGL